MKSLTKYAGAIFLGVLFFSSPQASAQFGVGWGGGWGWNNYPMSNQELGDVTVTADFDYNGFVDDWTAGNTGRPADIKRNPPGLVVGSNEMTRVDLSVTPNADKQTNGGPRLKFLYYKMAVTLDLRPVNLAHRRGKFKSFEEEQNRSGRMLVWLDSTRKQLLLDSADLNRRRIEFPLSSTVTPKHVYVEGVTPGDSGTVMLLTLILDDNGVKNGGDCIFGDKACWDATMLSVRRAGVQKPYVDRSPVWLSTSGGSSAYTSSK